MDSVSTKHSFKRRTFFLISRMFVFLVLLLVLDDARADKGAGAQQSAPGLTTGPVTGNTGGVDTPSKVICNVIKFVRGIGLPIMTGVIIGSSIMAIFGRLAWPAIAALVVFTAIFFGADKVIGKFADGVGGTTNSCGP
ncbi:MAG: TrbC/VirB2 family protein [Aaplasma endosymbiont of Hyalomma asiaticum]